jgi:cyclic pyranopterin phosphate synthase
MINISKKKMTHRIAIAKGSIQISPETLDAIANKKIPKGDVFETARVAGIISAKNTYQNIPFCHPIAITACNLEFKIKRPNIIQVTSHVEAIDKTGVEMEALNAVSSACLCIYDMCKNIDKKMQILEIKLIKKEKR